jgi:hypothetical protein
MAAICSAGNGACNDTRFTKRVRLAKRVASENARQSGGGTDAVEAAVREAERAADQKTKMARLRERAELVVMDQNRHLHGFSCRKSKRGKDGCRFAVPSAHGFDHTRCIQLGKRERQDEHEDVQPDDVRWCRACVVGPRAHDGPFTDEERQQVRRRIIDRGLHYEQVDVQPLPPRLPILRETSPQAAFRHLTATDTRCLVVEVRRPCPPAGAPVSTPPTAAEMLSLLKEQLDAEESLHTGSFSLDEFERRLGSADGAAEWLLGQCTPTHCDNGSVAEYCEVLSAMVECNTAVYHLGAGTNAKAASPTSVT